jgi:hypothetical protein
MGAQNTAATSGISPSHWSRVLSRRSGRILVLVALCAAVYWPILDNGFIGDDYDFMQTARSLKADWFHLFTIPPMNFRMTTFVAFALLDSTAGPEPVAFYLFNIAIHFINCLLLWKLIILLGREPSEGFLAAILFAVFHGPQEAVMWVTVMQETMQGMFLLLTLIFWLRKQPALSLLFYVVALFTKESAPLLMVLLPIVQWHRKEPLFPARYFLFWIPTLGFAGLFLWLWAGNSMIQHGTYSLGFHGLSVLALTLHRLIWPWLYIFIAAAWWSSGRLKLETISLLLLCVSVPMLPYIFLTYQRALPSRHLYMASMVLAGCFAYVVGRISHQRLRQAVLLVFLAFNIGFVWVRKDKQFEGRAAPTTALLKVLRTHKPTPILIHDFAYPYPDIAKGVSRFVPGWTPDLIFVEGPGVTCAVCMNVRWEPTTQEYIELK